MRGRRRVFAALACALAALGGCAPRQFEVGTAFDPAAIAARLHPGQSTAAEVRALLGQPAGEGGMMLPFQDQPHPAWTYMFARAARQGEGGRLRAHRARFLVFFTGDIVDGYLWIDDWKDTAAE